MKTNKIGKNHVFIYADSLEEAKNMAALHYPPIEFEGTIESTKGCLTLSLRFVFKELAHSKPDTLIPHAN